MPSYTILFMRRDLTDKRPVTLHVSTRLFWTVISLAVGLPIIGFAISAGVIAPAWLKLNFKSMEKYVEKTQKTVQPLQQQNASLLADKAKISEQLKQEMQRRAEVEARVTMAETARTEAATRLAQLEGENMNLRRSLATYERLLKPKLQRELVECVSQDISYSSNKVDYNLSFAPVTKSSRLPESMSVQVRVLTGNNAVAMEQNTLGIANTTQPLNMAKSQHLKGSFVVTLPSDTTRLLDVRVLDGNTPVGYCWKAF